ncbi:conserved hypothetical protein [Culex quinquefasciatus]|uniref:Uncharacterized protein n=1 Tax=Culex quinquefasciatus TaxID=7176 RepID=B0WRD7_CULQU|nr:conserved hypothetical protein [Culex quinquefasciatus]|eukprot:XP_001851271.1 conserved hypothetical protein [Culex quinquefasciatus]
MFATPAGGKILTSHRALQTVVPAAVSQRRQKLRLREGACVLQRGAVGIPGKVSCTTSLLVQLPLKLQLTGLNPLAHSISTCWLRRIIR